MADDEVKFDVRVRERLVNNGALKESEIVRHLEALKDVSDQAVAVVAKQPALQSESDRDIVIVRTSGVRPPPTPPRLDDDLESTPIDDEDDDLDDEDDDDEEDDEDKDKVKVKDESAEAQAAKKPAPVVEKPAPAPSVDSDEDEDEEKEKEKEEEGEKKDVDDAWGEEPA